MSPMASATRNSSSCLSAHSPSGGRVVESWQAEVIVFATESWRGQPGIEPEVVFSHRLGRKASLKAAANPRTIERCGAIQRRDSVVHGIYNEPGDAFIHDLTGGTRVPRDDRS